MEHCSKYNKSSYKQGHIVFRRTSNFLTRNSLNEQLIGIEMLAQKLNSITCSTQFIWIVSECQVYVKGLFLLPIHKYTISDMCGCVVLDLIFHFTWTWANISLLTESFRAITNFIYVYNLQL